MPELGAEGGARPADGSIDEWRVDVPPPTEADPAPPPASAYASIARDHGARVRADLEAWRNDLAERTRRLEARLEGDD